MRTNHEHIRMLNDNLRSEHWGGTIVVSRGVRALADDFIRDIGEAVATFAFDRTNDPYGEHDFGSLVVAGHHVIFKIDYYDRDLCYHSPDPADPTVTRRILTIMLAEEY